MGLSYLLSFVRRCPWISWFSSHLTVQWIVYSFALRINYFETFDHSLSATTLRCTFPATKPITHGRDVYWLPSKYGTFDFY